MKIYIAGKITGLVYEDALRAFCDAEEVLKCLGHEPVNPMRENGLDGDGKEHPWAEYMKRDIPHLLRCDGIYLLKNWRDSKGARLERYIAEALGMLVIYEGIHPATEPIVCDVCRLDTPTFRNKTLLGSDDQLCHECFVLWYDEGITDKTEIRRRRLGIDTCASLGGMNEICSLPIGHKGACSAKVAEPTRCSKCGTQLSESDLNEATAKCYRCRNSISSVSGVGIMTHAKV